MGATPDLDADLEKDIPSLSPRYPIHAEKPRRGCHMNNLTAVKIF